MKALVRHRDSVVVEDVARPLLVSPRAVRIGVAFGGICRTDLYVAEGQIACAVPRILGHEVAGTVESVGPAVTRIAVGQPVTVMPAIACGACLACRGERAHECERPSFLGLDRDGGFAEWLVVPEDAVATLPSGVSLRRGAYAEPVAAALGVLEAGLAPSMTGAVIGDGRIAELSARVLASAGFDRVARARDPDALGEGELDFVVETGLAAGGLDTLDGLMRPLRPGGTLVLKSRPPRPVDLDVRAAVARRLTIRAVGYGRFGRALELLASGAVEVDDLFGDDFELADFERAFAAARADESRKQMLRVSGLARPA